ncbi:prolipoprotein diacylglyceryl transferase [Myxococcota bacterium]|nr:prolipoprotein diacylglyceryl transferase [Myxococcota bacterium]MBU1536630.1 prolipoprotein diacylglyceryl transferase [Myxococcota bacterium]
MYFTSQLNLLALSPIFPYLDAGPFKVGPFTVHMFGLMVGLAILTGMYVTQARAFKVGVNTLYTSELLTWVVVGIFVGSHLFEILAYQPHRIARDPLILIRFWDGIASFGGMIGLLLAVMLYLRYRRQKLLPYLDVLMWGGVHAWLFGRLGCSYAHDHPGYFTDSWFSVRWPVNHLDQFYNVNNLPGRHDLGLYEFLYTFIIVGAFYLLNRKGRKFAGFTTALLFVMYAPMRFALDFLRTADRRYLGLTPAQYLAFLMFAVGVGMFILLPKTPQDPQPIEVEQEEKEEEPEEELETETEEEPEEEPAEVPAEVPAGKEDKPRKAPGKSKSPSKNPDRASSPELTPA